MKGYGIYWMILEFLRVQNGYKADVRILPVLARKMRVTVATLKRIIFDSGLFEVNNNLFIAPDSHGAWGHWKPSAKRTENRADVEDWLTSRESGRGMASDALPINQTNDINNSPLYISPKGRQERMRRFFFFHRSMHSTKIHIIMKD